MTHRPTLERWAALLRPLFPHHAEFEVKPPSGQLRAKWPPNVTVAIFIAPNAVKDYREADQGVRTLADRNLHDFVKENLRCYRAEDESEFRIVVASIDFVPLRGERAGAI